MSSGQEERPKRWQGGRIRYDREGKPVFEIRKLIQGNSYFVRLKVRDEEEARDELRAFLKAPSAYVAEHEKREAPAPAPVVTADGYRYREGERPIILNAALISEFQAFLRKNSVRKKGAGCSPVYIDDAKRYLDLWMEWLNGREFRSVDPSAALQWLGAEKAREKKIKFVRALATWLQRQGLRRSDNWTLELPSEQSGSRKDAGAQAYAPEHVQDLYRRVDDQKYRDALVLLSRYGFHYSELRGLADGTRGKVEKITDSPPIAGVIRIWHKNKKWHPVFVDAQGFAAAQRLQALGGIPTDHEMRRKLQRACGWQISQKGKITGKDPKVDDVLPLVTVALFRHTFISLRGKSQKVPYKGQRGLSLEEMVEVTGHSAATAKKHYDLTRLPSHMVDSPLKLRHPEDPKT